MFKSNYGPIYNSDITQPANGQKVLIHDEKNGLAGPHRAYFVASVGESIAHFRDSNGEPIFGRVLWSVENFK